MQKAAPQHASAKTQPTARQGGTALPSMLSDRVHSSPLMVAQRQRVEGINNSPRMVEQRNEFEGMLGIAQRVKKEHSLQRKAAAESAPQLEKLPAKQANHTGLPDNLKSGIESLSSMAMDHVKVHYNSPQPGQLNALAYAQGSEIHVAPGQEKHVPHEAWHVVQQMQGRVQATTQAKGIGINDDPGLEQEATTMGARALQLQAVPELHPDAPNHSGSRAIVQRARYLKCLQTPGNMAGEITRLTTASPLDAAPGTFGGNRPDGFGPIDMNRWLSGGAGISTTHYNPGQMQYYSPVGFIVDVAPERVLGNFSGDGSTSTLHSGRPQYWQAFETIRAAMLADGAISAAITAQGYEGDFAAAVTNLPTATTLKGWIEAFLANGAVAAEVKAAVIALIKATATTSLQSHYQNNGFNYPLGPGAPGALAPLEAHLRGLEPGASYANPAQNNREVKYTESQVHAELGHVVAAFYATEAGAYPDLIDAAWRATDAAFLANRAQAAQTVRQELVTAGNAGVEVNHLVGGNLVEGLLPAPVVPVPVLAADPGPGPGDAHEPVVPGQ